MLARRNLSRATVRSILAVVAIVIGVAAIGAIGTGGEAFKQDQLEAYEGFGGTATVDPVFRSGRTDATLDDQEVSRIQQAADGATVLPVVEPFGSLVRTGSGETLVTAQVKGLGNPAAFYDPAAGEIPDNWRRSVVVGSRMANNNDIDPGDRMQVSVTGEFDRSFRVVAVLEPQGFADPLSADRTVFVPLAQFSSDEYDQAIVQVDPQSGSIDAAAEGIETEFNTRERTVWVDKVQEQREQFESFFGTINQFLIGVGAISLLVAAVTIANTMLMSAIEREREIGVLRAVGYPKGAVVRLLVAESTILGVVGAAVGVPIAFGVGMVLNQLLVGDPLAFTPAGIRYIVIGAGFGVLTALVAGIYPAWKAATKRPVEALA